MSETSPGYRVTNEDEALSLLRRALAGDIPDDILPVVTFDGWPSLHVVLPHTSADSSISPSMMVAFLEYQAAITRARALITTESGDVRNLTKPERDGVEFRVKVSGGCSEYLVKLAKPLENIALGAINKMTPSEVLIAVLGTALIATASYLIAKSISSRAETRKGETASQEKKDWLDASTTMIHDVLESNKAAMALVAEASRKSPVLEDVDSVFEPARQQLYKSVGDDGGGKIQDIGLEQKFALDLIQNKRQQSSRERVAGIYIVTRVEPVSADGFRVTFKNVHSEVEITATLQEAFISDEQKEIIQSAEWSGSQINVVMDARKLRNRFIEAVVVAVSNVVGSQPTIATPDVPGSRES